MEEYIRKLLEQVRFQKAHKAIEDEIRLHIEDQTEAYLSDGMDKETAEKRAVRDMGDPIEAGKALDKVHRPQIAWGVIIAVMAVAMVGIMVQFLLVNDTVLQNYGHSFMPDKEDFFSGDSWHFPDFIMKTVMGISVMLVLYFTDFAIVSKYSRIVSIVWMACFLPTTLPYEGYILLIRFGRASIEKIPFVIHLLGEFSGRFTGMMIMLVPLYAGVLYSYKGQKGKTLAKALLWILIPIIYQWTTNYSDECVIIAISMLTELTIAIRKEWIKVHKTYFVVLMWMFFILIITLEYGPRIANYEYDVRDKTFSAVVESIYLFGAGTYYGVGDFSKPSSCLIEYPFANCVLTYIATTWGAFWAIVVVVIVMGLVVFGFKNLFKTRNQLGLVMGTGCMAWLALNAIANVFTAFGVFPGGIGSSFLPFVSNDYSNNLMYSYAALGILLSIYKYKDAYAEHLEIQSFGFRDLLKDLNL